MLTLIIGKAGSGKSEYVIEKTIGLAKDARHSVLMIPEQSSFELEKKLLNRLDDGLRDYVSVKSFKKLCDDIFKQYGGIALPRLSNEARVTLVRRAADSLGGSLAGFSRRCANTAFCASLASIISEFKNSNVDTLMLAHLADTAAGELTREKFKETALIIERCDELIKDRYLDASDGIFQSTKLIRENGIEQGVSYWFDGFTGFTAPELDMLRALLEAGVDVHITLCCDGVNSGSEVFESTRRTARRLLELASVCGSGIAPIVSLDGSPRFKQKGLAALEQWLSGGALPDDFTGLSLFEAEDPYSEAEHAAASIAALVRDEGYHFGEIAVVVRDTQKWSNAIKRSFKLYEIPYYCDWSNTLRDTAHGVFLLSALELTVELSSESIMKLVKTRLCSIEPDELEELENYVYIWSVERGDWLSEFCNNPDGFGEMTEHLAARLAKAESARSKIIGWLTPLLEQSKKHVGGETIKALYDFAVKSGAAEAMSHDAPTSAAAAFSSLDSLFRLTDADTMTPQQLLDVARIHFDNTMIGKIPQCIDTVQVGAADRMRMDAPRAVFCLGLNEGEFPRTEFDAPLFTLKERDLLNNNGADLASAFDNRVRMERIYLYRSLTAASERVYLSYSLASLRGVAFERSAQLEPLFEKKGLDCENDRFFMIVNERTAQKVVAESPHEYADIFDANSTLFSGIARAGKPIEAVKNTALLEKQLGESMSISATRIESFSSCPFAYFVNYVLGIRPRRKARMSPLEAGSFTHALIEYVMKNIGDIKTATDAQIEKLCREATDNTVAHQLGETTMTAQMRYLLERMTLSGIRLIKHIRFERQNSDFVPSEFELEISPGGSIEPRTLITPDGRQVRIIGKVDRVDVFRRGSESYIRVVDYKTGTKEFSLSDVKAGLSVQMLVYLFSVCENGGYEGAVPAGVLYLPADPKISASDVSGERIFRADGIVLDDPEIVRAMDRLSPQLAEQEEDAKKSTKSIFIPISYGNDGQPKSGSGLASAELLGKLRDYTDKLVIDIANELYGGKITPRPLVRKDSNPCDYCEYGDICRRDRVSEVRTAEKIDADYFLGEEADDGTVD